jgi:DNA-binding NtrC family response regulator
VVLTGHGSFESAFQSGREQAFRFLQKPIEHDALVAVIREAAQHKREVELAAYKAEMAEIIASGGTAREIANAIERLREKYDIR